MLVLQLRLRNQPISGNKDVLANRLLSLENNRSENPDAGPVERPLVRTFISEDAHLDNDDSDEEDWVGWKEKCPVSEFCKFNEDDTVEN